MEALKSDARISCKYLFRIVVIFILCFLDVQAKSHTNEDHFPRKNILHIIIDDLRPQLGAFEGDAFPSRDQHAKMATPHIDHLAKKSALFQRTYAQYSLCTPSRTSFLTGRRPESTKVVANKLFFRDVPGSNFTTLPQFFREHGYTTIGMGKVFHPHSDETPYSWDKFIEIDSSANTLEDDEVVKPIKDSHKKSVSDDLPDNLIRKHAIAELTKLVKEKPHGAAKQNFYLAVGFMKPHIPWVFPERFQSYYPRSSIHLPTNRFAPVDMPEVAWYDYHSLIERDANSRKRGDVHSTFNSSLPDDVIKSFRRAYYSCVSYIDDLVGDVLGAVKDLGLADDTVVLLHGDHGYHLGEHGEWLKQSQFEVATRTPLMIHIPGKTDHGPKVDELVELVDIFPTLVEIAGFPASTFPRCKVKDDNADKFCHEGISLVPLISKPQKPIKDSVFSVHEKHIANSIHVLGKTIITKDFRYTLWVKCDPPVTAFWQEVIAEELYDHTKDRAETRNVANHKHYREIKEELKRRLVAGWEQALTADSEK